MGKFKQFILEAYNTIPKNKGEITSLSIPDNSKKILLSIYNKFKSIYNITWEEALPISIDLNKGEFKLRRNYDIYKLASSLEEYTVKLSKQSFTVDGVKISQGEGTRNNKAGGGVRGKTFEDELASDIENYSKDYNKIKYTDIMKDLYSILKKEYGIDLIKDQYTVSVEGSKNQKRPMLYKNGKITFGGSDNIGSTVTDVTIYSGNKKAYISLKFGNTYYLINSSIRPYLDVNNLKNNDDRNKFIKIFGFNPSLFLTPYGIESTDNSELSDGEIKKNWEGIFRSIIGYGYIYIVGGGRHNIIMNNTSSPDIKVNQVLHKIYAEVPKRSYTAIILDVSLGDRNYKVSCQFRGTTASDKYPFYLRALVS